ncbi:hypothetical protein AAMO2058_000055400 [Amorphochlora amoebiformis]
MSTPSLELIYFDIPGKAEFIRLACALQDIPLKDTRFKSYEEFVKMKESGKFNYGQVPVLVIDGKVQLAQSTAILRYVGKLGGLYPTDALQAAKVDAVMDLVEETWGFINNSTYPARYGLPVWDEKTKKDIRVRLSKDILPPKLAYLEAHIKETSGVFFLEKISIADLKVWTFLKLLSKGVLDYMDSGIVKKSFPLLQRMIEAIDNLPGVKKYYAKK